jgi:simple sugar transport system permease protein
MARGERMRSLRFTLGSLTLAFMLAALIVLATGGSPITVFSALFKGAFGNLYAFGYSLIVYRHYEPPIEIFRTLNRATPLLLCGLAVAVGLRAGLFNIGAEGQLLVGALAAAWVGYAFKGIPALLHIPLAMLAGAVAGGGWGYIPGLLKAWRGAHEVIITIMMNYVAIRLTQYLVNHPLKDPNTLNTATPFIQPSAQLWVIEKSSEFSIGFFIAILLAAGYAFLMRRMSLGFCIRAVGQGAEAARSAGIPVARTLIITMCLSGALAGIGGAIEILGLHHRFYDQFSSGVGFDSIAVALLGGLNAPGIVLSAVLFGGLNTGAEQMQIETGTPLQIAGVIQAIVILLFGARYLKRRA